MSIANNISYHQWKQREAAAQCHAEGAEYEAMLSVTRSSLSAEELAHELIARIEDREPLAAKTIQTLIASAMGANRH